MAEHEIAPGEVWLVGAGPGDPDLLTRKAERLIKCATVIFHDALVGNDVISLARTDARIVSVGKRSGRHSRDQKTINALLVEAACAGERVVRLKGGDPSIFGRSMEEMDALRTHGIAVRICPGVTAASAAAASAGISLTMRGLSRKLILVTAHARDGDASDIDWAAMADPMATLAIYMGKAAAGKLADRLQRAGMPKDMPALIVENASLSEERIIETRLDRLGATARMVLGSGPALLLIGPSIGGKFGPARNSCGVATDKPHLMITDF